MKLSLKEVEEIAKLAKLELTSENRGKFATQLSEVFNYVAKLGEVDTTKVEPTAQITGLENVWREDLVSDCDPATQDAIIKAFPESEDRHLKVKAIL